MEFPSGHCNLVLQYSYLNTYKYVYIIFSYSRILVHSFFYSLFSSASYMHCSYLAFGIPLLVDNQPYYYYRHIGIISIIILSGHLAFVYYSIWIILWYVFYIKVFCLPFFVSLTAFRRLPPLPANEAWGGALSTKEDQQ